jgi:hypothetical protein
MLTGVRRPGKDALSHLVRVQTKYVLLQGRRGDAEQSRMALVIYRSPECLRSAFGRER